MLNQKICAVAALAVGFGLTGVSLAEAELPPLEVYLLIGQSNMAGRAPITEEEGDLEGCYLLNGEDVFEEAKNPLNRHSTIRKGLGMQKLGPGYAFARKMREAGEGVSLGLVVNAKGGTKIEQWEKGTEFYQEAVRRAKVAQKSGTLKGVLWHQGEGNSKDPDTYLEKLERLITDLREDLGEPDLPFVAGQIVGEEPINGEIARLPEEVKFTGVAESEGLVAMDRWHFDRPSMLELGERYAKVMLKVQGTAR